MADTAAAGLVNLEKELTCSICTEVLYQPLTLLDCLHTFCGSCLKLWFAWQAEQSAGARSNPYTCPSCRATVLRTRPDAKINTLLDLYLQANPSCGKSQEDKDDIKAKYTPGEDVIPKPAPRRDADSDDDDRRMLDEARAMSLRDVDSTRSRGYERGVRHAPRSRDRRAQEPQPRVPPGRNVEHQSSLRSLISSSDAESDGMEEEILRQIMEEGLLDGIDLHHMTVAQEDELSERIADAYRRRHGLGARPREQRRPSDRAAERRPEQRRTERAAERRGSDHDQERPSASSQAARSRTRQHARSASASDQADQGSRPPVSRPHLLEARPAAPGPRRRTASESRGQARSSTAPVAGSAAVATQAARSATDLSTRARASEDEERPLPQVVMAPRRSTESRVETAGRSGRSPGGRGAPQPAPAQRNNSSQSLPAQDSRPREDRGARESPLRLDSPPGLEVVPSVQSPTAMSAQPALFTEPSTTCERCGRRNIQYENHARCAACKDGQYCLCQTCYRTEKGCLHWLGFGHLALRRFQQAGRRGDPPHALAVQRHRRPRAEAVQSVHAAGSNERRMLTTDDPARRLMRGAACFTCGEYANGCFWQCDVCNAGELGFCSSCVNRGRCCSHALLPMAHAGSSNADLMSYTSGTVTDISWLSTSATPPPQSFPPTGIGAAYEYKPLQLAIRCSICHNTIPSDKSRYHCNKCDQGNYNMCEDCYKNMLDSGQISRQDGPEGWRRCLLGHRMIVYLFQNTQRGQERTVTRHQVGGLFLEDQRSGDPPQDSQRVEWFEGAERKIRTVSRAAAAQRNGASQVSPTHAFPPDGGVGLVVRARWPWVSPDGGPDNLSFPRNAEIREVTEISRDWYVGGYAGAKGVFPSAYVTTIGSVTMP